MEQTKVAETTEELLSKIDPVFFDFQVRYTPLEHIRARLAESFYFVEQMESYERAFQQHAHAKQRAQALHDRECFLYCFLAFLSAAGAVRNYIIGATPKRKDNTKFDWRVRRMSGSIYELFAALRDYQTHSATLRIGIMFDLITQKIPVKIKGVGKEILVTLTTRVEPVIEGPQKGSPLEYVEDREYMPPGSPRFSFGLRTADGKASPFEVYLIGRKGGAHVTSVCQEYVTALEAVANEGAQKGYL